MSNDETKKKRWRVREYAGGSGERQAYEDMLNELHADGYDIYEVDYVRRWVTACLDDSDAVLDEVKNGMGIPVSMSEVVGTVMGRLARSVETQAASPSLPEEPEDEGSKILREYNLKGQRTNLLLYGLNNVLAADQAGDPYADQRLTRVIHDLFSTAPTEETRNSLADIEFMRDHHNKYQCTDPNCPQHKIYQNTSEKLRARLNANPAN